MRTPAVHFGGLNSWTFWKNGAQFYFLKNREISCHHPFKTSPPRCELYQAISKKKFGLRTYTASDQRRETWLKSGRGLQASHLGEPLVFAAEAIWRIVRQSFFTTLLKRNRWRNNNCAVACTRTVEVLKRLIGTLRRCGAGGEPRGKKWRTWRHKSLINPVEGERCEGLAHQCVKGGF